MARSVGLTGGGQATAPAPGRDLAARPGNHGSARGNPAPARRPAPSDAPLRDALRPSGPAHFKLSTEHRPDAVVMAVQGELDVLTAPKLGARLHGVIRAGTTDVVLDLREVEFMDSAGLQILLITRRRLLRSDRSLSVLCAEGPVSRLIELSRLTEALGVTTS